MARMIIASAGNAYVEIEWRNGNLRLNKAHIVNNEVHSVGVTIYDASGAVLWQQDYLPGVYEQTIPGSAARNVTITVQPDDSVEIDPNGFGLGFSNPARGV